MPNKPKGKLAKKISKFVSKQRAKTGHSWTKPKKKKAGVYKKGKVQ
jgi:hypothetical protein